MDSEALPPIPTPPGQRWREFRIQVLPLFVFVVVLGGLFTLWSRFVQPIAIVGLVETNAVNVTTTQAGLLTALAVNRFDEVTNGQILGEVAPYDPEQVQAQLAAIESSINVVKARMELNELGNLDASANLRINFYIQQTLLEVAKVNVEEAKLVLDRDKMLLGGGGTESVIASAVKTSTIKIEPRHCRMACKPVLTCMTSATIPLFTSPIRSVMNEVHRISSRPSVIF